MNISLMGEIVTSFIRASEPEGRKDILPEILFRDPFECKDINHAYWHVSPVMVERTLRNNSENTGSKCKTFKIMVVNV